MSSPLPLLRDDDSTLGSSSCAADGHEAGFGALSTERGHLPLESLDVLARIDGLLSRSTVRQVFVNAFDIPLEAVYIFPLPDRAAVTGFRMEVAGRVIDGVLEERGKARETYEQAIAEGKRAAIAEEDRPGVFNLRVGNLMPGDRAAVELTLCGVLPYAGGEATFRFPLVVAPRYIPGTPLPGPSVGDGTALDTEDVPDASRITPPVLLAGFPSPVRLSLMVDLHDGEAATADIRCSLHAAAEESCDGYRRIRLFPGERLDRDFILRFRLGDETIRSTLTLHPDSGCDREGTFALTVVPPVESGAQPSRPRAVAFVLDRSGSMEGWKIVAARRAVARMIDTLRDCDRFCVIAFDSVIESPPGLPKGLAAATDQNRFRAVEYLAGIGARGGTEMAGPLDRAVKVIAECSAEGQDRVLVLITDGQVGNEDQILKTLSRRLKGIRVFTLGIDRAVNEGFLRRLAESGGGACELVESEERLDEVMQDVHRRIGTPLLTGLYFESEGIAIEPGEVVPRRLPDLFSGSPLLILGRYRGRAEASLTIHATDARGHAWSERLPATARDNPAIASAWARGQIRQIEDRYAAGDGHRAALERAIVALSLKFHVLSRFTAYVAVDRSQAVNRGGALHQVVQPVEMPDGWVDSMAMTLAGAVCCSAPTLRVEDFAPDRSPPSPQSPRASRAGRSLYREERLDRSSAPKPGPAAFSDAIEGVPSPEALSHRFELHAVVAHGGVGLIYTGRDRADGKPVLVKVTPREHFRPELFDQWRQVKETLTRLGHPVFVPAIEMGYSGESFWHIMPIVAGQTLSEKLRSAGRIPFREAAELVAELAEALHLAHEQGLAHGDLKPDSISLGADGQTRLLDFGELPLRATNVGYGRLCGTPAYLAPERVRGVAGLSDRQSEVHALGVILYEIMTGALPYTGARLPELLHMILNNDPKRPRQHVRTIPAALEAICLKAIAKDPAVRYSTAGELATALRGFLAPARRKGFWKSK
jgi:Ca-activated chloride channel homolog